MSDSPSTVAMEATYSEENCLKVSPIQNVARQDSGVPEDLASPINDEDPDLTMNSECNITVIHITENKTNEKSLGDNKDSKDGSDSGVEGCAAEVPEVSTKYIIYHDEGRLI